MSVFVWGSNKCKQLPEERNLHRYAPEVIPPESLEGQVPIQIAAGDGHTVVLSESGDVYSYGRGREGQLGRPTAAAAVTTSASCCRVSGLDNETIVQIAAGAMTTYAVTLSGEVYQWGLIHASVVEADKVMGRTAGELAGMAEDQDTTMVEVDTEARRSQAETHKAHDAAAYASSTGTAATNAKGAGAAAVESPPIAAAASSSTSSTSSSSLSSHRAPPVPPSRRRLRDIIQESTERWLLPTEQAEQEYFAELKAMGYEAAQVDQMKQGRGREYEEMLELGCKRVPQFSPLLIPHLDTVRVVAVAAGYAHTMLLTDRGLLYAAGYNDRGQLGLGHRINTSVFKLVEQLSTKIVLQVACGQQHTICRVCPGRHDPTSMDGINSGDCDSSSSSRGGGDVYTFGNGVLGQLGQGRLGTTRGCLVPTLVPTLHALHPLGIVSVSAGANFSAVVSADGSVYSFGHAEYNQHGTGHSAADDYVDAFYYFIPRRVSMPANCGIIRSVSCGSAFTLAVDTVGNMYSWGWNESGVLGHGTGHFSSAPQLVSKIGPCFDHCRVISTSTGSGHAVALTEINGNHWASMFQRNFEDVSQNTSADCILIGLNEKRVFYCHRAVLYARSQYLAGSIRAAERENIEDHGRGSGVNSCSTNSNDCNDACGEQQRAIEIDASWSVFATPYALNAVLEYLYTDRVRIPFNKRKEVLGLASDLHITRLKLLLAQTTAMPPAFAAGDTTSNNRSTGDAAVADAVAKAEHEQKKSTFTSDFLSMLVSSEHADICLVRDCDCGDTGAGGTSSGGGGGERQGCDINTRTANTKKIVFIKAHSVLLKRIPYFAAILQSQFSDALQYGVEEAATTAAVSTAAAANDDDDDDGAPCNGSESSESSGANGCMARLDTYHNKLMNIVTNNDSSNRVPSGAKRLLNIQGLIDNGIDEESLQYIITFAYVGKLVNISSDDKSATATAANVTTDIATTVRENKYYGNEEEIDLNIVMKLLVAANWLNFSELEKHCERLMSLHLTDYFPTNAENCLEFSRSFNFRKLEQRCVEVLRRFRPPV